MSTSKLSEDISALEKSSSPPNVAVLAIAQGLFTAAIAIDLTLTGLTGYQLAPDKSLATLPFALITVAGAIATYFASTLMQKIGRRRGFVLGALTGAIGGLISVWAVFLNSFWLFCMGTAAVGIFQAFAQYYRLAATDSEPDNRKARAISLVLAGGVIAAFLGPLLASWSTDLFPVLFAGSYLMVCLLGLASAALLWLGYQDALPEPLELHDHEQPPRKLLTIFKQPISLAALSNNVIGGVVMMFIMTATPLAAVASNHSINDGASIIQWHLVGMYAPSLFAGRLIALFGLPPILFLGMALSAACGLIAQFSDSLTAFYIALLFLGVGWNFMFVGGTTLLTSSYYPSEKARVQGVAEFIQYTFTAFSTLAAGPILQLLGWKGMNNIVFPLIAVSAVITLRWMRADRRTKIANGERVLDNENRSMT
ncbi:MFS transporter [Pseudomonas tolaasii]|uniref:MFS family arabinose efflux permease n=2 Tax=Pseudomonas TaxID=286 RepID=A0ABX4QAH0_PSETO|nr:MFS transporter [Pseudomonas tolaasii]ARB29003.1 MFS transporter [Pseudomonas tolaasii]KAB0474818.1 MFS transporter [Pseudomonas tolaasii]PKA73778.1 putative MFS family arabinose efflux permease [Pseudomonas tolaasii NCPPB 2192]